MTKDRHSGASPKEHERNTPSGSRPRVLAVALKEAKWNDILPQLLAYAERRLRRVGWASGPDRTPSASEARQLVNEAVKRSLEGERGWNEDDPPELVAFLCGVIRSLSSDEKKAAVRAGTMEPVDSPSVEAELKRVVPTPEDLVAAGDGWEDARLMQIEAEIADDDDLRLFYMAVVEEGLEKREDIAGCLGWTPDKVSVVRKKLNRRLNGTGKKGGGQ